MSGASYPDLVGQLHRWIESMRVAGGYGGPVSHWWRHSLRYTGPGLDWRYEGIIHGYLNLYDSTGDDTWLQVAQTAGQDLVDGQLATGNYQSSGFERNPEFGGTPHEACVSGALLRLARVCRADGSEWEYFATTARRNLQWHLDALWRNSEDTFSDTVGTESFVPNKIASTVAAFLYLSRLLDDDSIIEEIVKPATETIFELQVSTGPQRGAIHQLWVPDGGEKGDGKFFPLYIARCIPPLLAVGDATGDERFTEAAVSAGDFLARVQQADGSFPQVVYESGHQNVYPKWVAGVGDILRAYEALDARGHGLETWSVEAWFCSGFDDCGALRTAEGFGRVIGAGDQPQFVDLLHVVGWNDKAFRWLTSRVEEVDGGETGESRVDCTLDGSRGTFVESADRIGFVPEGRGASYEWDKTSRWAQYDP